MLCSRFKNLYCKDAAQGNWPGRADRPNVILNDNFVWENKIFPFCNFLCLLQTECFITCVPHLSALRCEKSLALDSSFWISVAVLVVVKGVVGMIAVVVLVVVVVVVVVVLIVVVVVVVDVVVVVVVVVDVVVAAGVVFLVVLVALCVVEGTFPSA